jgi:hypothetical protein
VADDVRTGAKPGEDAPRSDRRGCLAVPRAERRPRAPKLAPSASPRRRCRTHQFAPRGARQRSKPTPPQLPKTRKKPGLFAPPCRDPR